ncbi:Protein of unknown function [Propionibacterium freudenreichii]|uniref:Uncharacterized protein n=2 Tax=Propionibacterium freudenreichii TaxID=1744 RepID=D7GFV3_PROFC|nr:Hypothetical protein PFREUD_19220 [Propionibacterium freudenreichii subsp. shermanii CIRM-BIA1]CDP49196.1 Protein of unknown function [Propionibacterium freudenreichii subsp. freudenreichii]CEG86452.1 Protein of unknown function [Propionibacterium freudenreichii]CEG88517.1 Protein of unknown function [Propionibacterium freudenreichii]CEG99023.1 Protein of unknown function [Propionibacterium freudenreichii]
MKFEQGHSE